MAPLIGRPRRSWRALLAALALILALPATTLGGDDFPEPTTSLVVDGPAPGTPTFVPLINSGDTAFGDLFSGIPDGIGAVPRKNHFPEWLPYLGHDADFVDLYVTHEESRVPFGGSADFQDSSVSRVRIDVDTHEVVDMEIALPPSAGFIRFCSAFMAGPREGFPFYTYLLNEESNDPLAVPAGAVYGADPSVEAQWGAGTRQAGYTVWLNTVTKKFDVIAGAGRHNHENTVVVPGGWLFKVASLSGDDTFTSTSDPQRPNLSQLYMYLGRTWLDYTHDRGKLLAFQVTATQDGPLTTPEQIRSANDYLDMGVEDNWKGKFIPVPDWVADGFDPDNPAKSPQDVLEDWSNANNVFQFVRVEDIDYDPDNPRVVYFADTGNSRIESDATSPTAGGRLYRNVMNDATLKPWTDSDGRVFRMVLNRHDPRTVDSFSIVAEGGLRVQNLDGSTTTLVDAWMRSPDNLDAGSNSLMLQEDAATAKIWQWNYAAPNPADVPIPTGWIHIATAAQSTAETSGILDVSRWFGAGWWALDVQSHVNLPGAVPGVVYTGPGPNNGVVHTQRREQGQLLLMHVPGS
jgi:hypothetical protein